MQPQAGRSRRARRAPGARRCSRIVQDAALPRVAEAKRLLIERGAAAVAHAASRRPPTRHRGRGGADPRRSARAAEWARSPVAAAQHSVHPDVVHDEDPIRRLWRAGNRSSKWRSRTPQPPVATPCKATRSWEPQDDVGRRPGRYAVGLGPSHAALVHGLVADPPAAQPDARAAACCERSVSTRGSYSWSSSAVRSSVRPWCRRAERPQGLAAENQRPARVKFTHGSGASGTLVTEKTCFGIGQRRRRCPCRSQQSGRISVVACRSHTNCS